jgi:hypothetical protein
MRALVAELLDGGLHPQLFLVPHGETLESCDRERCRITLDRFRTLLAVGR